SLAETVQGCDEVAATAVGVGQQLATLICIQLFDRLGDATDVSTNDCGGVQLAQSVAMLHLRCTSVIRYAALCSIPYPLPAGSLAGIRREARAQPDAGTASCCLAEDVKWAHDTAYHGSHGDVRRCLYRRMCAHASCR
ncbi:hypothetical protein PENTCL1PPCAC_16070, partial [Pristionchus entomophagus]